MKYKGIQERVYDSNELQIRAVEGPQKEMILEGYAALYNVRSKLLYNQFYEIIERGAFDEVVSRKDLDVVAVPNHRHDLVVARTANGTLELKSDDTGLFFRAVLNDTSDAIDLYKRVQRGDIFQNSFAFMPAKDGYRAEKTEEGTDLYVVTKVETLRDISPVTFPAYAETSLSARELTDPSTGEVIPSIEIPKEKFDEIVKLSEQLDMMLKELFTPEEEEPEDEEPENEVEDPSTGDMGDENRKLADIYKMRTHLLKIKNLK